MGRASRRWAAEKRRRRKRRGHGDRADARARRPPRTPHLRHPLVRRQTPRRRQVPSRAGGSQGLFGGDVSF